MNIQLKDIFVLLIACFIITACNNDSITEPIVPNDGTTLVTLAIGPSIEVEESPITSRTNEQPKGLYAINIQWKGKGLTSFQPYASGLFDDISQITIKLIDGYLYRFDCTFLEEEELPCFVTTNDGLKYGQPFGLGNKRSDYAPINNKLLVAIPPYDEKSPFYQGIYWGETAIVDGLVLSRPPLHRYYGTTEFDLTTPATESPMINIELWRAYYHLQFESGNIPLGDRISITVPGTESDFVLWGNNPQITTIRSDERLLTLEQVANNWNGAHMQEETLQIKAEYYNGETKEWYSLFANSPSIKLKRNKRNIVRLVNISRPNSESHISIAEGEIGGAPGSLEEQEIDCKQ